MLCAIQGERIIKVLVTWSIAEPREAEAKGQK